MMTTETAFTTYGNEYSVEFVYGDLVLTAELKPLKDRVAWLINTFPDLKKKYGQRLEGMSKSVGADEEDESLEGDDSDMSWYD